MSLHKSFVFRIDSFHSNNWIESWLSSAIFDLFRFDSIRPIKPSYQGSMGHGPVMVDQNQTFPESSKVTAVGLFDSSSSSSGFEKAAGTVPVIRWPITRGFWCFRRWDVIRPDIMSSANPRSCENAYDEPGRCLPGRWLKMMLESKIKNKDYDVKTFRLCDIALGGLSSFFVVLYLVPPEAKHFD